MSSKASSSKHASSSSDANEQKKRKRAEKEKKSKRTGELPSAPEIAEVSEDVDMLGRPTGQWERAHPGHPDWAMKLPEGAEPLPLDFEISYGEFDYDAIKKDPEVELWLVRVPNKLKPKRLADASIRDPEQAALHNGHAGYITDSKTSYTAWLTDRERKEEDMGRDQRLPGEEMFGMDVLLPRQKKGGKLYQAPKPITRHLVITASPAQPDAPKLEEGVEEIVYKNEPRQNYPLELLTHRFLPTGSESARPLPGTSTAPMVLDDDDEKEDEVVEVEAKEKEKKKKRKGHGDEAGERRSKKAKTSRAE
ncbi:hypothetical protein PENSPDRAFT_759998 [Peniophora sp. CONT]|nr:hypothetical protein PENSPDRAFT_759998 [Peniophora sp. CONT]